MRRNSSSLRFVLTLSLLAGLFFGAAGRSLARKEETPNPAPLQAVDELNIVISEFRTRGPSGVDDEFIEIVNTSGNIITIGGWVIKKSSSCGSTLTTLVSIPAGTKLWPGQHYLVGNSDGYSGTVPLDQSYTSAKTADDSGIALLNASGNIIDQVGMCDQTTYFEGTPLKPLTAKVDQSYERKTNAASPFNCNDTDNNKRDFIKNPSSSNPQNYLSDPIPCLVVTNVTSSTDDTEIKIANDTISIQVTFIQDVVVSGSPTLLLETGITDGLATFNGLSDGRTLNFTYTVKSGDITSHLDYISTKALSLNGGSITVGGENAILLLPKPGETGSLSKNKNIRIDATTDNPTVQAIELRDPPKSPTNADTLKFKVTFSKAVIYVDAGDFTVDGTTAVISDVRAITSSIYDITVSGGNLPSLNGTVTLRLNPLNNITDVGGKQLVVSDPPLTKSYVVDNQFQSITIVQASDQIEPAITAPIKFIVTFAEKINPSTFTSDDVIQGATGAGVPYVSWRIDPSTQIGDEDKVFILSGYPNGNGDVAPSIPKNRVEDLAGNLNADPYVPTYSACGDPNNDCVVMKDTERPTVTIVQAPGQADPSTTLPIKFNVQFSEPINIYSFTASDITQAGDASGVTWSITNPTGDKKNFSISAITSGIGILQPIIEENRVLDSVGNGNEASASNTDNKVRYQKPLSVTVDQASKQQDPTVDIPIAFTVKFSEKINSGTFTVEDIVQKGTVTGVKWSIENLGNNKDFILRAIDTDADSYGTVIPFIPAKRVKNEDGSLENLASTSTDGSVTYVQGTKSVVISEVAWMGTQANSSHEWIELFNTTRKPISLDGWRLISFRWSGTQFVKNLDIALKGVISPRTSTLQNNTSGYFLLVANENAVSFPGTSETYDQKYSGSLYNTGEILLLCSTYNIQVAKNCDENHKTLLVDFVNARSRTGTIRPWPAGSSTIYGSMERQDWRSDDVTAYFTHTGANPHFGMDANGNFIKGTPKHSNWAFTVTSTPRPTALPTRTATPLPGKPPILVLNEVLARAGTDWNADGRVDVYDEFIEVINAGTSNLNLSNYRLSLASAPASMFSLPSQTLKPGERMVFYGSQSGLQLKDSGDTVRLLRASNNSLLDSITYPIADVLDSSVCRYADGYGSWIVGCYPTPGLPNALTGGRLPSPIGGQPVCNLPDSTPREFVLAECEEAGGSGMWNPSYWDSFPGEGQEIWISDPFNKWLAVYQ